MNKKLSLGVSISLVAIAVAVTFVLTMTVSLQIYNSKIAGVNEREEIYGKLQELDSYVRSNFIGEIDNDGQLLSILQGYVAGTGDTFAEYLTPESYYEEQQRQRGRLISAGFYAERASSGYIRVTEVYEGSSAEAQGIIVGDVITAVDGVEVLAIGAEAALKRLTGDDGTRVTIGYQRAGAEAESRATLVRQEIVLQSAVGSVVGNIGYIRVSGFTDIAGAQLTALIDAYEKDGAAGYIFDVRGTSGYLTAPLRTMMNRIIPSANAATAVYKDGQARNIVVTDDAAILQKPIVVLTNGETSALGELFAAILKDYAGAAIVGTPTRGNAVLTAVQAFRDGSAIRLSVAKMQSTGATFFDGIGISPDYFVDMSADRESNLANLESTADLQIKKAFDVIRTKIGS